MTNAERDHDVPGIRLYSLLLRVYPARFRSRYAADMVEFYRERMSCEGARTPRRILAVWGRLLPDLISSGFSERLALHRSRRVDTRLESQFSSREESMTVLEQDVRYAFRNMLRRPGFTAVVLATLALGIGANAAIFTVVNTVLLRPLPFANVDRIVDFAHEDPYSSVSEPEFVDYQRGVPALAKLAAYGTTSATLSAANDDPTRTRGARVTADFFGILGVQPELGRALARDEFSHLSKARIAVISHKIWVQRFAGDPRIAGRTLHLNGNPFTIVGVMPAQFSFPSAETAFWVPLRMNHDSLNTRNNHYLRLVGELASRASVAQATAQVRTLGRRWMREFPETYFPDKPLVGVVTPIREQLLGPTRPYLLALLGAVAFILLIACVNVANLLLVRGEGRRKEFAIRAALGASGSRMLRQMLTESMIFALLGAVAGGALAWFGARALVAIAPDDLPRLEQIGVDFRVVAFTTAITIVTGLLFGIVPAIRGWRGESMETLRDAGKTSAHGSSGLARRALVVTEVALAVVMLSGAGLLIRSLVKLQAIDLGFDPRRMLTMQLSIPPRKYTDTTADELFRQTVARVRQLPGVRSAAAVGDLPISGNDPSWSIMIDGRVVKTIAEAPTAKPEQVTPEYFRAMSIRLLRGRVFTERDRLGAPPVAVISEAMAKRWWPGVDPIGHTLKMFNDQAPWVTIVGIVADVRSRGFQAAIPETMYFPYSQSGTSAYYMPPTMTLIVRTDGNPTAAIPSVRAAIRAIEPSMAISAIASMEQVVGTSISSRRFTTVLLAGFAALALLLAGIGIYGVIAYGVSQRTYEIGVRMALGASTGSITALIMREGARMTLVGLGLGLVGAGVIDRLLQTLLVGITSTDVPTLLAAALALAAVAACACALPARRATAVSPTEALRGG